MISLLLRIDPHGACREVVWSQPSYLANENLKSLLDLFDDSDKADLLVALQEAQATDKILHCARRFRLRGFAHELSLCLLSHSDRLLVFAAQIKTEAGFVTVDQCQWIVQQFLTCLLSTERNSEQPQADPKSTYDYEQIQKLNNDLTNTHRRLHQANAQLNRLNEELNNRLVKDTLTGLVSRYQYRSEIERLICESPQSLGVFCFIDIDDFKKVNDTYGHAVGDAYLVAFAERLKRLQHSSPIICMRISGDEFGLYFHGLKTAENPDLEAIWQQIRQEVLMEPVQVQGHRLKISCSVGMAVYGQDTREIYDLIDYADFAMYQAKNAGRGQCRRFSREEYNDERTGNHPGP